MLDMKKGILVMILFLALVNIAYAQEEAGQCATDADGCMTVGDATSQCAYKPEGTGCVIINGKRMEGTGIECVNNVCSIADGTLDGVKVRGATNCQQRQGEVYCDFSDGSFNGVPVRGGNCGGPSNQCAFGVAAGSIDGIPVSNAVCDFYSAPNPSYESFIESDVGELPWGVTPEDAAHDEGIPETISKPACSIKAGQDGTFNNMRFSGVSDLRAGPGGQPVTGTCDADNCRLPGGAMITNGAGRTFTIHSNGFNEITIDGMCEPTQADICTIGMGAMQEGERPAAVTAGTAPVRIQDPNGGGFFTLNMGTVNFEEGYWMTRTTGGEMPTINSARISAEPSARVRIVASTQGMPIITEPGDNEMYVEFVNDPQGDLVGVNVVNNVIDNNPDEVLQTLSVDLSRSADEPAMAVGGTTIEPGDRLILAAYDGGRVTMYGDDAAVAMYGDAGIVNDQTFVQSWQGNVYGNLADEEGGIVEGGGNFVPLKAEFLVKNEEGKWEYLEIDGERWYVTFGNADIARCADTAECGVSKSCAEADTAYFKENCFVNTNIAGLDLGVLLNYGIFFSGPDYCSRVSEAVPPTETGEGASTSFFSFIGRAWGVITGMQGWDPYPEAGGAGCSTCAKVEAEETANEWENCPNCVLCNIEIPIRFVYTKKDEKKRVEKGKERMQYCDMEEKEDEEGGHYKVCCVTYAYYKEVQEAAKKQIETDEEKYCENKINRAGSYGSAQIEGDEVVSQAVIWYIDEMCSNDPHGCCNLLKRLRNKRIRNKQVDAYAAVLKQVKDGLEEKKPFEKLDVIEAKQETLATPSAPPIESRTPECEQPCEGDICVCSSPQHEPCMDYDREEDICNDGRRGVTYTPHQDQNGATYYTDERGNVYYATWVEEDSRWVWFAYTVPPGQTPPEHPASEWNQPVYVRQTVNCYYHEGDCLTLGTGDVPPLSENAAIPYDSWVWDTSNIDEGCTAGFCDDYYYTWEQRGGEWYLVRTINPADITLPLPIVEVGGNHYTEEQRRQEIACGSDPINNCNDCYCGSLYCACTPSCRCDSGYCNRPAANGACP